MATPDAPKPKALIVISSARTLPLAQPSGHPGISTGFFLVELENANRLTGNGPQAIDDQAAKLRQLLDGATQRGRPATTGAPA